MPGANYMGGRRNAAKARVKDTTGRLEKSFFGQRRLCAASQAMGRNNVPLEESIGGANISLGHAKRKIPSNNDVITSSFIPSPIDVSPNTPTRSWRRRKKIPEAHSSGSNVGRSKVLDALDVSEPMFLRQVLDRILTMPDLAGISRNQTKPTLGVVRQLHASDESSPLQRTKRKRSASHLHEGSDFMSDDYNIESTGIEIHEDAFSEFSDDVQGEVRSSTSSSRDYRSRTYSISPKRPSSNYTLCSNPNSIEITGWKEGCPTSIVFRGLKNSSAKRSMTTTTYPVEEPTVFGTLFEQADPWDTIGQILGLPNTKPSKSPREIVNGLSHSPLIETGIDRQEGAESAGTALNSPQQKIAQVSEMGEIEGQQLVIGEEYESALAIPELEESDGLFIGPSLFELDKDEDKI